MIRLTIARLVARAASMLVPSGRRAEWLAEWSGELAERRRRDSRGIVRFALGAVPHAFAELRQDWSVDVLSHELRHAVRTQLRNPAYTLTASLLIALGVGANTTVFTLVNAILFRAPYGVADPSTLVQLGRTGVGPEYGRKFDSWSYPLFTDFRNRNTSFVDLAAFETRDVLIGDGADVARVNVQLVSSNYFTVLGAVPQKGRGILAEDLAPDAPPVTVLSDALWVSRFGADPDIVGKSIRLRGTLYRVVGIAAPEFHGTEIVDARPELWVPLTKSTLITPGMNDYTSVHLSWLNSVGRLKPGVTPSKADAEMKALFRAIQLSRDDSVRENIAIAPLGMRPDDRVEAMKISGALMAMVGLVLLVTCANLAALLLARGTAREGELGVRLAIGAGRGRVVRQLLVETALLALLGSVFAFVCTRWTARFVETLLPGPLAVSIQPDSHVLLFGVLIGVSTSVLFGIVPALKSTRVDLLSLLRSGAGGAGSSGVDRGRLRSVLLVAQIALSFVLLGAAGLLARTVQRAATANPGFRTEHIVVGEVDVRTSGETSNDNPVAKLEALAMRARQMPGVEAVSLASAVATEGRMGNRSVWRPDAVSDARPPIALTMVVDTGYLPMMGIPLLAGRGFDATLDPAGQPTAVVINESLAKLLWSGESAVGKQLAFGSMQGRRQVTVVGVARDTRNRSLRSRPAPQVYLLLSQNPAGESLLHVRMSGPTTSLSSALHELMPGTAPVRFESIRSRMARGYAEVRLIGMLGATFGVLALLVASGGIYGVVSYETERRRREFGVRLALGARPSQVHAMVIKRSARLSTIGIALGLIAFIGVAPALNQWVFGVSTFDAPTLATITAVLLASAGVAAVGPAARASRADPSSSLRSE